jgi:nitrile hydratase
VLAATLTTIMRGVYNVDQWRAGIDDLEPRVYTDVGYYGRWLHTLELNCVQGGVLTSEEIEARISQLAAGAHGESPPARADPQLLSDLAMLVARGASNQREVPDAPRFATGARVRARALPDEPHARIPGYAQGRVGVVERVHGAFVFCDSHRRGDGEDPQYVYTVRFDAHELWPDGGERCSVLADLWDSYLDPAD